MSMYVDPAYPDKANDPRLMNVRHEWQTLSQQISDAEWRGQPVTKAERDKLSTLKHMLRDGKIYTPKF